MSLHNVLHFLACRDCGVLYPIASPERLVLGEEAGTGPDPYVEFLTQHWVHRIACFWRRGSEIHASRPLWDPMATVTFEVTDGTDSYVVEASRSSLDDERVYRFTPGALVFETAEVQIDSSDLRRGLDGQFYPHALRPTKVDRFLSAVHEVLEQIHPEELEIAFDAADDPAVSIAGMPEGAYNALLARCEEIFDPWELPRVVAFLHDNRHADGLLALHVRRPLAALSA